MANIYDPVGSLRLSHIEAELLQAEARKHVTDKKQASPRFLPGLHRVAVGLAGRVHAALPRTGESVGASGHGNPAPA